jgi:hypothetical protein
MRHCFARDNSLLSGKYYRSNDDLADDNALADAAALTRESIENSPVPIKAVPPDSLVPDDTLQGFDPPLV